MEYVEKVELLNATFATVFTTKTSPEESQALEVSERVWRKEDFPLVKDDYVRDHLGKLDIHKSMGPDGMHPQVLRELADIIVKPLSIIFKGPGEQATCLRTGGKIMSIHSSNRARRRIQEIMVSLTSILGKVMEQLILDVIL
ncbi:rna-directed dna polymerase from mobile element jockey-like [Limosa lapponica baueri]|uniref:Rna-directed dna polymerase from mobile element jockey-like n=1 Tax=Limosa lapponica baueri TaxID=1758121 RepID=A0A2I0U1D7_LIMLA|nr:rna-directed dna polymerase from mobile element jockey-like [Limosa lapponica baueri]